MPMLEFNFGEKTRIVMRYFMQADEGRKNFAGPAWHPTVPETIPPEAQGRMFPWFEKYSFSEGGRAGLSIALGYNHVSDRWGDNGNNFKVPSYDWFQLGIRYRFAEHYEVALNIENLFDEKYIGLPSSGRFVQRGHPRWIKAKVMARF